MQPNHRTLYRLSTVNDTMNGDFFGSVVNPEVLRCCSDGPQTDNSLPRCSLNFLCLQTHPVCFHSASWSGLSSVPVGLYFGPDFSHPGHFVIDGNSGWVSGVGASPMASAMRVGGSRDTGSMVSRCWHPLSHVRIVNEGMVCRFGG